MKNWENTEINRLALDVLKHLIEEAFHNLIEVTFTPEDNDVKMDIKPTTDNLLIDFYENGRINYQYSIATTENHITLDFPFQLAAIPFATGTGILNSKSVNIVGIKTISNTSIEVNIPTSGKGCLSVQGLYKNIANVMICSITFADNEARDISYEQAFKNYTFADGTPFGVKVEE